MTTYVFTSDKNGNVTSVRQQSQTKRNNQTGTITSKAANKQKFLSVLNIKKEQLAGRVDFSLPILWLTKVNPCIMNL